jgi:hypothetical protein
MMSVTGDGNREGEAMGVTAFRGEEGEEAKQLHGVSGEQHNEERYDNRGGQRWRLAC